MFERKEMNKGHLRKNLVNLIIYAGFEKILNIILELMKTSAADIDPLFLFENMTFGNDRFKNRGCGF